MCLQLLFSLGELVTVTREKEIGELVSVTTEKEIENDRYRNEGGPV